MRHSSALLVVTLLLFLSQYVDSNKFTKEKVNTGIQAGKELANLLKSKDFQKTLTKLAGAIGPMLGAVGPLVGLVMAFAFGSESAELKFMKKAFEDLNRRLDTFQEEFNELKRLVKWSAIEVSYAGQAKRIKAMNSQLKEVFNAPPGAARNNSVEYFIMKFESDFQNSAVKLYNGIVEQSHVFGKNLLTASMEYTQKHRRRTRVFMSGLIQLLLLGAELELAYFQMKGWTANLPGLEKRWQGRMNVVRQRMASIDNQITAKWHTQMQADVESFSASNHAQSNQQFDQGLYTLLADKFDWRYWLVLIYQDVSGGSKHYVSVCGGLIKFRNRGKNIVVSSVDKKYSTFSQSTAKAHLETMQQYALIANAEYLLKTWSQKKIGAQCSPYAFVGFVCWGCNVWFYSYNSHRAYKKINPRFGGSINALLFG